MDAASGRSIVAEALRAASRRGPRAAVAGALVLTGAAAAYLDAAGAFAAPGEHSWRLVAAGALLWVVWAFAGGAVTAHAGFAAAGRALGFRASLARAARRLPALALAPLCALLSGATLLGVAALIAQVVRVPAAGVVLLALLSPAILFVAIGGLSIVLSHVLAGPLVAADLALCDRGCFGAMAGAYGLLRRGGAGTVARRAAFAARALVSGLPGAGLTAGAAAAVGFLLCLTAHDAVFPVVIALRHGHGGLWTAEGLAATAAGTVVLGVGAWVVAWPAAALFGARAVLFLSERQRLDGLSPETAVPPPERRPSLLEMGVALVERLKREEEGAP